MTSTLRPQFSEINIKAVVTIGKSFRRSGWQEENTLAALCLVENVNEYSAEHQTCQGTVLPPVGDNPVQFSEHKLDSKAFADAQLK